MCNIKLILVLAFWTSLVSTLNAQETKKVTLKHELEYYTIKEVFNVLTSDPNIKHGTYASSLGHISEKGEYTNDKKTGIWEYRSGSKIVQKYDFNNNTFLLNKPSGLITKVWEINSDGSKAKEINIQPVFLGSDEKILTLFVKSARYPAAALERRKKGIVRISATITQDGKMIDEKIESNIGYGLDEEGLKVFRLIPDDWIPASVDGKPIATRIELKISFSLS